MLRLCKCSERVPLLLNSICGNFHGCAVEVACCGDEISTGCCDGAWLGVLWNIYIYIYVQVWVFVWKQIQSRYIVVIAINVIFISEFRTVQVLPRSSGACWVTTKGYEMLDELERVLYYRLFCVMFFSNVKCIQFCFDVYRQLLNSIKCYIILYKKTKFFLII